MTEEQTSDVEFVKQALIAKISDVVALSAKLKDKLITEVIISIVYLKIFSAYLQEKKFDNLEEAWRFMNDTKGIIDKVFYVDNYMLRVIESMEKSKKEA